MRTDENNNPCPETLGEYYDFCEAFFGASNKSCLFLLEKIKESPIGRDEKVLASDSQVREVLFHLAVKS